MRRTLYAMLAAAVLLVGAVGYATAKEDREDRRDDDKERKEERHEDAREKRGFHQRHGKWVLYNDHIAVWFHAGKEKAKPDLRISFNSSEDDEKSGYRVKILRLYETGPDSTQFRGSMPHINLARSDDWNIESTETDESLTLRMTRAEAQGIVTLVWHIDTVRATVKYDLEVENWQWANESNRLVLDMLVVGKNLKNATGANVTVEDSGYIRWAETAQAKYDDGRSANLTVSAVNKRSTDDDDDKDDDDTSGAHLLLVFEGAGGYDALVYDPEFGVQAVSSSSVSSETPGLAPMLVVAVAFGVALLAVRRRV